MPKYIKLHRLWFANRLQALSPRLLTKPDRHELRVCSMQIQILYKMQF